jgi:hypothetical protein
VTELVAALQIAWDADATLSDVPNPFAGLGADGASYPFATFGMIGQRTTDTFDRTVFQDLDVQVAVYATVLADLNDYARALEDLLHHPATKLATDEPVAVMSQRQRDRIDRTMLGYGPSGETVYATTQTYRFQTHRDLPS